MSKFTIQDIFNIYGEEFTKKFNLSKEEWKVFNAIRKCKTSTLGYHTIICEECGEVITGFNSCRNRHCPMCQFYAKERWINNESSYLLDCPYFHIVTTVPHELNEIALHNKKIFYNMLFKATSEAILELANNPKFLGAKVGITSIIHTWGQTLEVHPHLHCIVTGGGLTDNNKWVFSKENYLFEVKVLSSLFKGKFLSMLKDADLVLPKHLLYLEDSKALNDFLRPLYNKSWVTYIEPPKGNPLNVIEYIGRYAFRIAISNERIKDISDKQVIFEYKDYKDNGKVKLMNISIFEFMRRFLLHVLPDYFTKIKHYGLLANRSKKSTVRLCRILIGQRVFSDFTINLKRTLHKFLCPICNSDKFHYNYFYPLKA